MNRWFNVKKYFKIIIILLILFCVFLISEKFLSTNYVESDIVINGIKIPEYNGDPYIEINNNKTFLNGIDYGYEFEIYTPLDELGRCGVAFASISKDDMPNVERDGYLSVRPSGWHTVRYDDIIADKYLYNRCHLIAYQLTGQLDNELNLITGTRYMNISGMLPFENRVANYLRKSDNHVYLRVTPIFIGSELVCRGVLMEAKSLEADDLEFCVFIYNVQPGIIIDYLTGDSYLDLNNLS